AAILIFDRSRKKNNFIKNKEIVSFIDASREFEEGKNQNKLRDKDIEKILQTLKTRKKIDKYSYLATLQEIEDNEFNLNVPRYVDTFEESEEVDILGIQSEIDTLEKELFKIREQMKI